MYTGHILETINHGVEYNDQWDLKEMKKKKPNEGSQAKREVRKNIFSYRIVLSWFSKLMD